MWSTPEEAGSHYGKDHTPNVGVVEAANVTDQVQDGFLVTMIDESKPIQTLVSRPCRRLATEKSRPTSNPFHLAVCRKKEAFPPRAESQRPRG